MANRTKVTAKKRQRFLELVANSCSIVKAALAIGVSRNHLYRLRDTDANFAIDWDKALQLGADVLEEEVRRRAVVGVREPVYYKGDVVGHVRKYSDILLIFRLKGLKPDMYRDRYTAELSGPGGTPLPVQIYLPDNRRGDSKP